MEQFNRYFLDVLKNKYMQFSGRASRSEFWYFILFYFIISFLLSMLDTLLGTSYTYEIATNTLVTGDAQMASAAVTQSIGYLGLLFGLVMFLPSIAISIRRLHDTGKSGWWLLISLIPIIGFFVLLFFYVQDSQPGENEYGPNPKGL